MTTKEAGDALRDLQNWVAVFAEEYDLPDEMIKQLRKRIEKVALALEDGEPEAPVEEERVVEQEALSQDDEEALEEELADDEIHDTEEGAVRGYWQERQRAWERGG